MHGETVAKDSNSAAQSSTGGEKEGSQVKKSSSHLGESASARRLDGKQTEGAVAGVKEKGKCEYNLCDLPSTSVTRKGHWMCDTHRRKRVLGPITGPCAVESCEKDAKCRSGDGVVYCATHYQNNWQTGDPLGKRGAQYRKARVE